MKWFHHECAARHDPKLQVLGSQYGAEGSGIYWGLLEDIGQHSDTFHLKVIGISMESDKKFLETLQIRPDNEGGMQKVPILPIKILAKNLFTSPKKLKNVIELCVNVGLFDADKWLNYNLLYSPSFEHRADDYTRRINRKQSLSEVNTNIILTKSIPTSEFLRTTPVLSEVEGPEQSSNIVQSKTDKVLLETETDKKENINKTTNTLNVDNSFLIEPDEEQFDAYCLLFHSTIQKWNKQNQNKLDWHPSISELKQFFYHGDYEFKVSMCYASYNILRDKISYPEIVIRALSLMLKTLENKKIANPFGWIWTCLHGNGNGVKPWVQLLTAEEENNVELNRRDLC
jgi:hypothetical protein